MRLMVMLSCLIFGAIPGVSHAEALGELIEPLSTGHINWTQGVVVAHGATSLEQAVDNVLQAVAQVRLDTHRHVSDRVGSHPQMWAEVKAMALASKIVAHDSCPDGSSRIILQMNLVGGFAQLLLPPEIRQVEPIKPLNGISASHDNQRDGFEISDGFSGSAVYTGLIVDARDTGAKPAMVPVLADENGKEVYSPAFVSREFAVQQGVCQYVRDSEGLADLPRVGPKPLLVKGLRTSDEGHCNIVISNADASKLHGASAHLTFLKQCRVIIVID